MKSFLKLGRLTVPNTVLRASYAQKVSDINKSNYDDIKMTLLLPDRPEDFEDFKKIITDEKVVFTSPWIHQWFGVNALKRERKHTEIKLELLADGGDRSISFDKEMKDHQEGKSSTQIAIDRFFSNEQNLDTLNRLDPLKEVYSHITQRAADTGLGYYKISKSNDEMLGGCSLAPILDIPNRLQKDRPLVAKTNGKQKIDTVEVALHLFNPTQGLDEHVLKSLLEKAFTEHGINQVVSTSMKNNMDALILSSSHGMKSQDSNDGMKHHSINKEIWTINSQITGEEILSLGTAATQYRPGKESDGYSR